MVVFAKKLVKFVTLEMSRFSIPIMSVRLMQLLAKKEKSVRIDVFQFSTVRLVKLLQLRTKLEKLLTF